MPPRHGAAGWAILPSTLRAHGRISHGGAVERAGAALPLWKIRDFPRVNILPSKGGAAAPRAAKPLLNAVRLLLWYHITAMRL